MDLQNIFALTNFRCIENLLLYYWGQKNRSLYERTPPYRSSLNRGSTDCTLTRNRQYGGSFKTSRLGLSAIYLNLKTFRHFKTQREKLCNNDVNRARLSSISRILPVYYLTIRPAARKGYGSKAHKAKPNGLLTCGP